MPLLRRMTLAVSTFFLLGSTCGASVQQDAPLALLPRDVQKNIFLTLDLPTQKNLRLVCRSLAESGWEAFKESALTARPTKALDIDHLERRGLQHLTLGAATTPEAAPLNFDAESLLSKQLESLYYYWLTGRSWQINWPTMGTLKNLKTLALINFSGHPHPNTVLNLSFLPDLPALTSLTLERNNLTTDDLVALKKTPQIQYLSLPYNRLNADVATVLNALPNLEKLILNNNPLGENFFEHLTPKTALTHLSFANCETRGSIMKALQQLHKLPCLQSMEATGLKEEVIMKILLEMRVKSGGPNIVIHAPLEDNLSHE